MSRSVNGSPSVLDVVVAQWPSLVFVPAVLVLITVLVLVTRWWDRRDAAARLAEVVPLHARRRPSAPPAARPSLVRSGRGMRRRWLGRTRCTCSWHAGQAAPARSYQGAGP